MYVGARVSYVLQSMRTCGTGNSLLVLVYHPQAGNGITYRDDYLTIMRLQIPVSHESLAFINLLSPYHLLASQSLR